MKASAAKINQYIIQNKAFLGSRLKVFDVDRAEDLGIAAMENLK